MKSALEMKKEKESINNKNPLNTGNKDGAAAADVLSAEEKDVTAREHFIKSLLWPNN